VLYDGRDGSATGGMVSEYFIGDHNPLLVRVPAGVLHGWKCVSQDEAYVINAPNEVYRYDAPDEHRVPWDSPDVPYDWDIVFQ
jgi:dTDP-4-dehydrorhamnose 3,5-epimerase